MASSRTYADFVLEKFARLDGVVSIKPMMGEYVIHMAGKVLGFIGDDRLLFQPGPTIEQLLPDAERVELFPGSKLMYIMEDSMSPSQLCEIATAIYDDLPVSKAKGKSAKGKADSKAGKRDAGAHKSAEPSREEIERRFPFSKNIDW